MLYRRHKLYKAKLKVSILYGVVGMNSNNFPKLFWTFNLVCSLNFGGKKENNCVLSADLSASLAQIAVNFLYT